MDYQVVGKIDLESNVVFNFEELDFSSILENKGFCDCCKTNHFRKTTYVVSDSKGKLYQVGTSCLEKLMGRELDAQECSIVGGDNLGIAFPFFKPNDFKGFDLRCFIYNLIVISKNWGYNVDIKEYLNPYGKHFEKLMAYLKSNKCLLMRDRRYEEVDKIIEFYKNKNFYNNFKSNVKVIVESGFVDRRYVNIAKYIVKVYEDEMEFAKKCEDAPKSIAIDYTQTTIVSLRLKENKQYWYAYNDYTDMFVYIAQDINGNWIEWSTSKFLDEEQVNKLQNATIKYRLKNQGYTSQIKGYVNKVRNVTFL